MRYRVVVEVIGVSLQIILISKGMFPETLLPDRCAHLAMFCNHPLDEAPAG